VNLMPSTKNINEVKMLKDKLQQTKALLLADYRGLTVAQVQELKKNLRQHGAELIVTKNRLLKIALKQKKFPSQAELTDALTGPTIVLFCQNDEVGPIKALYEYAKKNELPEIKAGFLGKDFLAKNRVISLAQLPGIEELRAKLVGSLNSPIYGFVSVLSGNLRQLVYVLNAIKNSKS